MFTFFSGAEKMKWELEKQIRAVRASKRNPSKNTATRREQKNTQNEKKAKKRL